ncbi:MAG: aminotransferase class I/II-fold pyridoxal phosphate-dependent enzyme [Treponemataceae bacterium]|nr:aminotransferase class I/II-fold pyridoxal phosphate-dependent enzyme [Treponemataceae bacterium]
MLNPLAQELNETLKGTSAEALFSDLGRRMYFPNGIISQGAEAKKNARIANGTIGMTVIDGTPAILPSVHKYIPELTSREIVAYAPTAGLPELREIWKSMMIRKNPLLADKSISLPAVVPGLTAGLSYIMDLFVDAEKPMLASCPSWDNYVLIAEARRGAEYHQFTMFDGGKFNLAGLEEAVKAEAERYGSVRIILNFPQNPSGYSPSSAETAELCRIIKEAAESGAKLLVISDDAYFGLNYEDDIESQSLFAHIANLHENVLAVKADGPTKEDFVWGFRCGFLTFGCKGFTDAQYDALVKKLMGVIRSSVSCGATPSQAILLRAFQHPENDAEKAEFRRVLEARYKRVRAFVDSHESDAVTPLPFNSGYFMSLQTDGIDAEQLRKKLLADYGIGTVSIDSRTLRVAFSSIDEDKIETVYEDIYRAAGELKRG